ncbi:MAG: bifunctional pyr operon transcriptional regulator/uracil phosphoribosyltransferase PyrR [Verrucomicrobiales bacterium]|nr:bifunctional pyr operon transcriptional regulator/uracil phosphoribosyltransferase PyrR [Verrucomicrobiales bacterium]
MTTEEFLSEADIANKVRRLAYEILETCRDDKPAFVGIFTRGVTLAKRVAAVLEKEGHDFPIGTLDISLYRDDLDNLGDSLPTLESSDVPFALEGTRVILFDEVVFTGRTIRAALDGLMDYGRPSKIELAVLVDRGHREIPIQPDYVGVKIETKLNQYVRVRFQEDDGEEGVFLITEHDEGGETK